MIGASIRHERQGEIDEVILENRRLRVVVLPACGGKISSLVSQSTGREWFWRNPHLSLRPPVGNGLYIQEYDTGGLDEVFPGITPLAYPFEPFAGMPLPDHGELWDMAWSVDGEGLVGADRPYLQMSARSRLLNCVMSRRLELDGASLSLVYTLKNESDHAVHYVWAAHALMRIEPGMRIAFPRGTTVKVRRVSENWPGVSGLHRFEDVAEDFLVPPMAGPGRAAKLFTGELTDGWVDLLAPSNERLRMRFGRDEIPVVAVWANYGFWSGSGSPPYWNLGIEPTNSNADSVEESLTPVGYHGVLEPRASLYWQFDIIVD